MFSLPRLPVERQRNVGQALEEHFKGKPEYAAIVMSGAKTVLAATPALDRSRAPSMFTIDVVTDRVISAVYRIVIDVKKGYATDLIPLDDEQQAQLDAAELLEREWFPNGIAFIHDSTSLQNAAMTTIRKALADKETGPVHQAAVETLGLGPLVRRLLAHMRLYAQKLGLSGEVVSDDLEARDPSDIWHDAFVQFAIDVSSTYRGEPSVQKTLLGAYETQLAEYRRDQARERKKAKAEAAAKASKPGEG